MKHWLLPILGALACVALLAALLALQAFRDREMWEWCCFGW